MLADTSIHGMFYKKKARKRFFLISDFKQEDTLFEWFIQISNILNYRH